MQNARDVLTPDALTMLQVIAEAGSFAAAARQSAATASLPIAGAATVKANARPAYFMKDAIAASSWMTSTLGKLCTARRLNGK